MICSGQRWEPSSDAPRHPSGWADALPRPQPRWPDAGIRTAVLLAMLLGCAVLGGCNIVGFVARVFTPKVKARYQLPDRPTLILVDDPANLLGDTTHASQIAHHVGFHLKQEELLLPDHIISPRDLYDLAVRLGDDYPHTPIDRIGREVAAQQVVYILVKAVGFGDDPGIIRPAAQVRVKVIDAARGSRLFPALMTEGQEPSSLRDYPVAVKLPYTSIKEDWRSTVRQVTPRLAQRIARDVSRLFYDHHPRQPGEALED